METAMLRVLVVVAPVLTLAAFFLDFPEAPFRRCCGFGLRFLGLVVSRVAITVGFSGASVTCWRERLGCVLVDGVVVV